MNPLGQLRPELGADELADASEHNIRADASVEGSELKLEFPGLPNVVLVQEGDVVTADCFDARISRGAEPSARQRQTTDLRGEAAGDIPSRIRGAIIGDDNVERLVCLVEDALDRLREISLPVARRDHDSDYRVRPHLRSRKRWAAPIASRQHSLRSLARAGCAAEEMESMDLVASRPLASVVIPVFDGIRFLAEAIQSVLDQTYQPLELIVVDDGSNDGSAAVARSFPGAHVIEQKHAGPGAARNRGIAASTGDMLAFLDADDVMPTDKLELQVGYLNEHPDVGCVLGRQQLFGDAGSPSAAALAPPLQRHPELQARGSMQPLSVVARRSVFETVGNFVTDFGEDLDWLCRVWEAGVRVEAIDAVVVRRRVHDKNLTHDLKRSRLAMFRALREHAGRTRATAAMLDPTKR
jgi:GT2 family glycosyltransferase